MMEDLRFIAKLILLRQIRRRRSQRQRTSYIRPLFLKRNETGESKLLLDLRDDPYYHYRYFRMDKQNFDWILEKITLKITHPPNHVRPISPLERLGITLRYLASGNSQISLALSYRISPSSICNVIRETMTAICDIFKSDYLPTPTENIWIENEKRYNDQWNFPNACGSVDGKHVRVKSPPASGSLYYNYKTYFSVVLLAISNADFQFTAIDIGSYGSESDGGILAKSAIGKQLAAEKIGLPSPKPLSQNGPTLPHVILGDDAFPLRHYMLKPYKGNFLSEEHRTFNYRLSRGRMTVENSFGILAARWRIFHSTIEADIELTKTIILTSVLLHNFLTSKSDFNNITVDRYEGDVLVEGNWRKTTKGGSGMETLPKQGSNNYSAYASKVRDDFKTYFLSEEGKVSWQEAHVNDGI